MSSKTRSDPPRLWARAVVGTIMLTAILAAVAVLAIAVHFAAWMNRPVMPDGRVNVVVPRGTSWSDVVTLLDDAGVVNNPRYFDVWGRHEGVPARVKAGAYTFEGPLTLAELAKKLGEGGRVAEVTVTIPEGFNLWAIAERLDEAGLVDYRTFLAAARDEDALSVAGIDADSFEGYLFPDTYRFAAGSTAHELISRMHARFEQVWGELPERAEGLPDLTPHELITLASIVEKETAAPTERPAIARVFYNRMAIDMRLQTDPTCVYSESRWKHPPRPSDCKDSSNPYSTYVIDGLPPGPIANPGRAALSSVMQPNIEDQLEGVLYFVAVGDGSGKHQFSKTLDEHNAAIKTLIENRAKAANNDQNGSE